VMSLKFPSPCPSPHTDKEELLVHHFIISLFAKAVTDL